MCSKTLHKIQVSEIDLKFAGSLVSPFLLSVRRGLALKGFLFNVGSR